MDRLLRLGLPQGTRGGARRAGRGRALNQAPELGVGLIGYGYSARTFHAPLIAATPGLRLVRAAVRSAEAAAAAEKAELRPGGLEEVLTDPAVDLLVVATPTADHAGHATEALLAGKHVVVDKPMTATIAEAESLVALAARQGRTLSVFHNRRWDADFLSLRATLASDALGDLVELNSTWDRFRPVVRDRWRERPGPGAGVWYDLGSHLVDQALQLFGWPASLSADIGTQRAGALAPDYFQVRLTYPSALKVVLAARTLALAAAPRFVAHGTGGSYVKHGLDPQEAALQAGEAPGAPGWGVDAAPGVLVRPGPEQAIETAAPNIAGDYTGFYAAIRDTICLGGEPPVRPAEAAEVVRLLELAAESAATGQVIAL